MSFHERTRTDQRASMRWSLAVCVVLACALTLVWPASGRAQGWIEPRPGMPAPFAIEKLRTNVTVRVSDRIATVEVEEWFRNNGGGLGEGDYVYPLPGEAVFSGYSLYQGDEELRGEMMDAAKAREIYEAIVRAQRDPALIELIGKGMLRARVFPIQAGETRRITLRYTQVLERAGDALQFRYVAGGRTVGLRPTIDAQPVPAPRPFPPRLPQPIPFERDGRDVAASVDRVPVSFTVIVERARAFRDAFSPTHDVRVERDGARMTVRPRGELRGDFSLFLPFAEAAVGLTVATHRPAGEAGYFLLTLSPGEVAESRVPRDLTAVVDVSGSMSGEKMEQARRALHQLLGSLNAQDRLRLIAFSSGVRLWRDGWSAATPATLREARGWIDELRAEGGTNIHGALERALDATSPADRLPVVIFLTDGLPTNGETNPERIASMAESNRGRARIFAFGVGYDVNTVLLDRLSEAARGTTQYVRPAEDVEQAVSSLALKIRHPVLTDLALERGGMRITEVHPREIPDLFAGEELVLFGRYEGSGMMSIGVRGRRGERTERYATDVRFAQRTDENEYIARLWASRKVGDLERRIRMARVDGASHAQLKELVDELRETALRYGVLSEHTAYLVQEPVIVAGGAAAPAAPQARAGLQLSEIVVTGQAAVARAETSRRSRDVASVADLDAAQKAAFSVAFEARADGGSFGDARGTRVVAGRVFVMQDGEWRDQRHDERRRTIHVEPYSAAYFALLQALPELSPVWRELVPALVSGERVAVRVAPGGAAALSDAELRRTVAEFRTR